MFSKNNTFFTTPAFVIGILFLNLRPLIDKLFVTQYFSSSEVVLMGTVSLLTFVPECIVLSTSYAIQSLTSRFSEKPYKFCYLFAGCITTIIVMIPLLTLLSLYPTFFLHLISEKTPTDPASLTFFRLSLIGCFFQCLIFCLRGFYSAYRNNRIFFSVIVITLALHSLFNKVFLSGLGLFSPWGIQGMGLSYCLATMFGFAIYAEQLLNDARLLNPTLPSFSQYSQLLKRAVPLAIHGIVDHIGTTFIFTCTSSYFGLIPLASLHLVSSMQGISPGAGFGLTALTEVTKTHVISSSLSRKTGEKILIAGCFILGVTGLTISLAAKPILALISPYDLQLQSSTLSLMQITFSGLFLHVGCQIMLKILQAVDKTIPAISINLGFIYCFRIPLLFSLGSISNASVETVGFILISEKLIKLIAMIAYWQFTLSQHAPSKIQMPPLIKSI
ncbi:MAG: hypothetical protein VX737_06465 [Pseudomonadota bacterium]|nr:hypothetical protein [Pseudomonadota bacterium]